MKTQICLSDILEDCSFKAERYEPLHVVRWRSTAGEGDCGPGSGRYGKRKGDETRPVLTLLMSPCHGATAQGRLSEKRFEGIPSDLCVAGIKRKVCLY